MSDPFFAEIRMAGFTYPPRGFVLCQGGTLPIGQNTALFSLMGTAFGGDGRTTFGVPNLGTRAPLHAGTGPGLHPRVLGGYGGEAGVYLQGPELPSHTHTAYSRNTTDVPASLGSDASGRYISRRSNLPPNPRPYNKTPPGAGQAEMAEEALSLIGGNRAHDNRQPSLAINFILCIQGDYPSRS